MRATERRKLILEIICERRFETASKLAEEFNVTVRTIYNDVLELSLSYPIYTKQGEYGGIYIAEGYYIGRQYLTDEQKNLLNELTGTVNEEQAKILQSIISKFARPEVK